jgi:hypothetical protein
MMLARKTLVALALPAMVLALAVACDDTVLQAGSSSACEIDAPKELVPAKVRQIRLGMSLGALSRLLGKPAYSPIAGRHYFLTGGMCPMSPGANIMNNCGVIAEFRHFDYGSSPKDIVTDALQSCHWGAISE